MPSPGQVRQSGFTIIEVLFVLAIAGVILLLVFEAIPNLVRNSHNNERRQDVAAILQAVSHYELADSGNFPLDCGHGGPEPACTATTAIAGYPNDPVLRYSAGSLTFYNAGTITSKSQTSGVSIAHVGGATPQIELSEVDVFNFEKCSSSTTGAADPVGAGSNDVVALYAVETPSGPEFQCEQL